MSLYLDIVKNGDALLSTDNLDYYEFRMEDPVNLDNRMQYVVSFRPRVSLMYALFIGKLYIDYERSPLHVPSLAWTWQTGEGSGGHSA